MYESLDLRSDSDIRFEAFLNKVLDQFDEDYFRFSFLNRDIFLPIRIRGLVKRIPAQDLPLFIGTSNIYYLSKDKRQVSSRRFPDCIVKRLRGQK